MLGYAVRRLVWAIPVVLLATLLTFTLVKQLRAPFNNPKLAPAVRQNLREIYGLDDPFLVQYGSFLSDLAHGDLGASTKPGATRVRDTMADKLPVSMELGALAFLFAAVVGIGAGVVSALAANTLLDHAITVVSTAAFALPSFFVATLWVKYSPYYGWDSWSERVGPILVLGLSIMPYFTRLVRASMLEALQQDYIVTARSKGLRWRRTVLRHAVRNSLIPTVVNAGPLFGFVLTGSFIIERIMIVPGIADEFVSSFGDPIDARMILATTTLLAILIVLVNLVVDIVVGWLDPRITHD